MNRPPGIANCEKHRATFIAGLVVVLLTWGLYLWNVGRLRVFGDSAYSVYLAGQPVLDLLRLTAADSHPPLYYLLLAGWTKLLGEHEVVVRFLSLVPALLAVPLTLQLARRVLSERVGLIAAVLLGASPFALHYARLPRMYGWVMLTLLAAALALLAAVRTNRTAAWALYGASIWAALHLHYFTALGVVALNIGALPAWRNRAVQPALLTVHGAVGVLALPWFALAFLPSAVFTAGNIGNAPPPVGLLGFLEQYVIPFAAGVFVDESLARPLAWGLLGGIALLAVAVHVPSPSGGGLGRGSDHERRRDRSPMGRASPPGAPSPALPQREREKNDCPLPAGLGNAAGLPVVMVVLPLLLTLAIFVPFPYFARQRFLLFTLPFALVMVAALIVRLLERARLAGSMLLAALAIVSGIGVAWTVTLEPHVVESDAVQLADTIRRQAGPTDVIYLQAAWQFGYLQLHGAAREERTLRGLAPDGADQALASGRAVWVGTYHTGDRDPEQPLPAWLDEHAVKVSSAALGPTRVAQYVPAPPVGASISAPLVERAPVATLSGIGLEPRGRVAPGGTIAVSLDWQVERSSERPIAFFLHLDDLTGRTWAGRDGEPLEGIRPTTTWQPGERIRDARGLTVGPEVPAGAYRLVLGAYRAGSPPGGPQGGGPSITLGQPGAPLVIAEVRIDPSLGALTPAHRLERRFGGAIDLMGYESDLDRPVPAQSIVVNGRLDVPIVLTRFREAHQPGEVVEVDLYWRCTGRPDRDYTVFVHLLDGGGKLVAQHDGPPAAGLRPTSSWVEGEWVVDRKAIRLPDDLPPGQYQLIAGLYRGDTGERLMTAPDARGRVQDFVQLTTIQVTSLTPPSPSPPQMERGWPRGRG